LRAGASTPSPKQQRQWREAPAEDTGTALIRTTFLLLGNVKTQLENVRFDRSLEVSRGEETMIVEDILVGKNNSLYTVNPDQPVREAAAIFAARNIGMAVVVDAEGGLVGVLSERDLVSFLSDVGGAVLELPIKDLMTRSVVTCEPSTPIGEALSLMALYRIRHLPVVKDSRIIGLISIRDLLEARLEVQEGQFSAVIRAKRGVSLAQQAKELAKRARAEFFASVDGELRSSLNAIVETTDRLISEIDGLPHKYNAVIYAETIKQNASHLIETFDRHLTSTSLNADATKAGAPERVEAA
jgi:CBS domain-containing protein